MSSPLSTRLKPLVETISRTSTSSTHGLEFTIVIPSEAHFWDTVHDAVNLPPSVLELYQQLAARSSVPGNTPFATVDILPGALTMVARELNAFKDEAQCNSGQKRLNVLRPNRFRVRGCGFSIALKSVSFSGTDVEGGDLDAQTTHVATRVAHIRPSTIHSQQQATLRKDITPEDSRLAAPEDATPNQDAPDSETQEKEGQERNRLARHQLNSNSNDAIVTTSATDPSNSQMVLELNENQQKVQRLQHKIQELNARDEKQNQELASIKSSHEKEVLDLMRKLDRSESKADERGRLVCTLQDKIKELEQHGITQDEELVGKTLKLENLQKNYDYLTTTVTDSHTAKTQELEEQVLSLQKIIDAQKEKSRQESQQTSDCTEQFKRCGKKITELKLELLKVAELKEKCEQMRISPIPRTHSELVQTLMRSLSESERGQVSQSHFLNIAMEQ